MIWIEPAENPDVLDKWKEEHGGVLTCEYCQEATNELYPVEDSDRSVGYTDTLMVCGSCLDKK